MEIYSFLRNYKIPKLDRTPDSTPGPSTVPCFRNREQMARSRKQKEEDPESSSESSEDSEESSEEESSSLNKLTPNMC